MYIKLVQPRMKKRPMDTDIKVHMAPYSEAKGPKSGIFDV